MKQPYDQRLSFMALVGQPDGSKDEFVEKFETLALARVQLKLQGNNKSIKGSAGQAIMRAYLDLVKAAGDLYDAEYNESTLDLAIREYTYKSATTATMWCFVFSAFVSIVFISLAVLISMWGIHVHGVATENITALVAYVDGVQLVSNYTDTTCSIESQNTFKMDKFLGYPDTKVFWNLYGGLVLGLIFGFLDNFGLFYGMGALDPLFYSFGSKVTAGLMSRFNNGITSTTDAAQRKKHLLHLHTVTDDMMSGLGNTFSDLLGVALGTAALEIAKAGLNVDPAFWVLDLVAIVLGCLLGCFMPVLLKHNELIGGKGSSRLVATLAWINIDGLFTAVFLAGFPYLVFNIMSVVIVCSNIVFLVLMLLVSYFSGADFLKNAVASVHT